MSFMKAINQNYIRELDNRFTVCQARLTNVKLQQKVLKKSIKNELVRPGSLAAAFTLGVLVIPRSKSKFQKQVEARVEQVHSDQADKQIEQHKKREGINLSSIISSVVSATVVRSLTNYLLTSEQSPATDTKDTPEYSE